MVLEIARMSTGQEDGRGRKHITEAKEKDTKRKPAVSKKADLMDVRVIQRHLVYAVGLAADICTDQVLKGPEHFGKYGKIKKISVTWNNNSCSARQASAAAYVLYHTEDEAWNCIQSIDGAMWSGKQVRACYGTTKYCHSYLRKAACSNPECSYLHEPAPEEDTVTKDEMNPITGRKDILHLVHPGGTPRSRTKKAPVRTASQPIGVPVAAAASAEPDATEASASKESPAWAIPAPNGTDAIGTGMLDGSRDASPGEDSPQFVIAANAAPSAWPALNEHAHNTDSFSDRVALSVGNRRPSTKDVVTGTASAVDSTVKESVQGARMLPLAVTGRTRFGLHGMVSGSAPLTASSSRELQEDEHALSTMPSTELLGSRARLDLCVGSPDGSPTARPQSPSAMMPDLGDCISNCSPMPDPLNPAVDRSVQQEGSAGVQPQDVNQTHLPAATAAAVASTKLEDNAGERQLCALDLLPASLEDALDDRASLPTTAQVEEDESPDKPSSYPATPAPPTSHGLMHASGRKQSRFAFVNNEGTLCAAGATFSSLPQDLDNFSDAPAFKPGGAHMANMHTDAANMSGHACQHGWDQGSAEDHTHAVQQFSCPLEVTMGAAQHAMQQQQPPQQTRLNPAVAPGLEQPPMTHESVVQAVSAQLQQIMSQGGHASAAAVAAASRMIPAAGTGGTSCGMASVGTLRSGWSQMQQKAGPEQDRQEQMHILHALLQQHEFTAGMHEVAASRGMQHPSVPTSASQAAARQGLSIKRPPQPPKPMMSMANGVAAGMCQQHTMPRRAYMPQRNGLPMHDGGQSLHVSAGVTHALHQGGMGAASLGMQRGLQYTHSPASVGMVDPAVQRARALQHHISQFGGDAAYLADAATCGYGNWDAAHDTYSAMLGGPQMHALHMQTPLGNWHPRGHGWE